MHNREGNTFAEPSLKTHFSTLLRISAHSPKLLGFTFKHRVASAWKTMRSAHPPKMVKNMKWFNRKNTLEEVVEKTEQRFVIEIGHNRNSELIIKKMRVSGDDLEQCIADLQLALQDFKVLQAEQ